MQRFADLLRYLRTMRGQLVPDEAFDPVNSSHAKEFLPIDPLARWPERIRSLERTPATFDCEHELTRPDWRTGYGSAHEAYLPHAPDKANMGAMLKWC